MLVKVLRVTTVTLVLVLLLMSGQASATSILVSDGAGAYGGFGYGYDPYWGSMTTAMDAASGNNVTVTSYLNDLDELMGYDALFLNLRNTYSASDFLGATEISNISAFIATGRRVVMMGENHNWAAWDSQILGIAGGTYGSSANGILTSVVSNELTNGAGSVEIFGSRQANGGTALYSQNFATLWGDNVVTILDINIFSDGKWGVQDNAVFGTNVATWLANSESAAGSGSGGGGSAPVPEPATMSLLIMGLAGMAVRRHRKK